MSCWSAKSATRKPPSIAVQASLTGHLVLSTLHTNDAANAVTRLVDMGLEAYKLASALRGVLAQRLMRRLCPTCKEPDLPPVPERTPQGAARRARTLYRPVGCPDCAMTGYHGRFSIVEILAMNPELERLVGGRRHRRRIARARRGRNGMGSLWESGLRHVLAGDSSLEELLRVTDAPSAEARQAAAAGAAAAPAPAPAPAPVPAPPAVPDPPAELSPAFELLEERNPDGSERPSRLCAPGGRRGPAAAGDARPAGAGGLHRGRGT